MPAHRGNRRISVVGWHGELAPERRPSRLRWALGLAWWGLRVAVWALLSGPGWLIVCALLVAACVGVYLAAGAALWLALGEWLPKVTHRP